MTVTRLHFKINSCLKGLAHWPRLAYCCFLRILSPPWDSSFPSSPPFPHFGVQCNIQGYPTFSCREVFLSFPSPSPSRPGGIRGSAGPGAWLPGLREGGGGARALCGGLMAQPPPLMPVLPRVSASREAPAGGAGFYGKHRCFSCSYESITLEGFTWCRTDERRTGVWGLPSWKAPLGRVARGT